MRRPRNHYDNLKVDRKASAAEIKKAYRRLSSLHHPDKNGGSAESVRVMKCINLAYEILSNPSKRAEHDAWIKRVEPAPKAQPRTSSAEKEAKENAWEKKTETGFGASSSAKAKAEGTTKSHYSAEDVFKDFFGNGFGFESIFDTWRPSEPRLRDDHRPKNLDEKHLDEFTKFNDLMRKKLNGIHLEYATPELIYRAFIIDKRRGRKGPKTLDKAYKSLNRALKNREDSFGQKVASLILDRPPAVQGAIATLLIFSLATICLLGVLV